MGRVRWAAAILVCWFAGAGCGDAPSLERAQACLVDERFQVMGGESLPGDLDAPEAELIVAGREANALVGFHDDEGHAERLERQVAERARGAGARLERLEELTIVWLRGADGSEAGRIRDCLR